MVKSLTSAKATQPRKGMPGTQLTEHDFKRRYGEQFTDPAFRAVQAEIDKIAAIAWDAYDEPARPRSPQRQGPGSRTPTMISRSIGLLQKTPSAPLNYGMTPRTARRASW